MLPRLALVALCALLGCACTLGCKFSKEPERTRPRSLILKLVPNSNLSACQEQCCATPGCDTGALDGDAQCYLFRCEGKCEYAEAAENEPNVKYKVFNVTRPDPPESNKKQVIPLTLGTGTEDQESTGTRTEDQKNNTSDVCALPRVVGRCKAAFRRFFFNSATGDCELFIYGGCDSNGNNFETKQKCEEKCGAKAKGSDEEEPSEAKRVRMAPPPQTETSDDDSEGRCQGPMVTGPCRAAFRRWFFNQTTGRCHRFIYGGCNGNSNNYESEELCTSTCAGGKSLPSQKKKVPEPSDNFTAYCEVAPEIGLCRAAFTMFYFDPETESCKLFLYGGCGGNNNRYGSEAECVERCANRGVTSEGRGKARNRWTAAFFLFLTLAAVSFLLLTALIVINMRRHRLPPRTLSIRSDKEELLTDGERSSLDSLPLPESPKEA